MENKQGRVKMDEERIQGSEDLWKIDYVKGYGKQTRESKNE